jgi:hypothetical protein
MSKKSVHHLEYDKPNITSTTTIRQSISCDVPFAVNGYGCIILAGDQDAYIENVGFAVAVNSDRYGYISESGKHPRLVGPSIQNYVIASKSLTFKPKV